MNDTFEKILDFSKSAEVWAAVSCTLLGFGIKVFTLKLEDWFKKNRFNIKLKSPHESLVVKNVQFDDISETVIKAKKQMEETEVGTKFID